MPLFRALAKNMAASYFGESALRFCKLHFCMSLFCDMASRAEAKVEFK